jgi:hypothetical protein
MHSTVALPLSLPPQPSLEERAYQASGCGFQPLLAGAAPDSKMKPLTIGSFSFAHANE